MRSILGSTLLGSIFRLPGSLLFASVAAIVALLLAVGLARGSASVRVQKGSVNLVDKPWTCEGPVDLDSLSVTINQPGHGGGSDGNDAVLLRAGCTGRIGKVVIVQYQGDGIKISEGVRDLVVESGSIRCYGKNGAYHQDGVQAMGGERVTFFNLDDQCLSANNASFFVKKGINSVGRPTDIVCDGCFFKGGGFTVRIETSVRSGVRHSRIVAGRFGALRVLPTAAEPVAVENTVSAAVGGSTEQQPAPLGARPQLSMPEKSATPLAVQRSGAIGVVSTAVTVDRPAMLLVSAGGGKTAHLPLLPRSTVAGVRSGRQHATIFARAPVGREASIVVRLPLKSLRAGTTYRLRVTAQDAASDRTSTVLVPFRL
jgi:hypothetical protein